MSNAISAVCSRSGRTFRRGLGALPAEASSEVGQHQSHVGRRYRRAGLVGGADATASVGGVMVAEIVGGLEDRQNVFRGAIDPAQVATAEVGARGRCGQIVGE